MRVGGEGTRQTLVRRIREWTSWGAWFPWTSAQRRRCAQAWLRCTAAGVLVHGHRMTHPGPAELYERNHVLVRPDGCIAWRRDSRPEQPDMLAELASDALKTLEAEAN
jgi:hypothetical protein